MAGDDAALVMMAVFVTTMCAAFVVTAAALTIHDGRARGRSARESLRDIWTHR